MTGVFLVCVLAAAQSPSRLIDQLGDPRIDRREAADRALREIGSEAIPDLERALDHPCPEVRLRARTLLYRLPEFALRVFLADPVLARSWNAIVEALVRKRPIPADLWEGDRQLQQEVISAVPERTPDPGPHHPVWIRKAMHRWSHDILQDLARKVGVRGGPRGQERMAELALTNLVPNDLLHRLIRLRADETTLEEVYATTRLLSREAAASGFQELHARDWDTVLRYLVHIRRRKDRPPATLPGTIDEAWTRIERGPWLEGIADGLGRAFSNRSRMKALMESLGKLQEVEAVDANDPLGALYHVLAEIDEDLGRVYWKPCALTPADPTLPPEPGGERFAMPVALLTEIRTLKPSAEELRVLHEILPNLHPRESGETGTRLRARLLHRIAARVVRNARTPQKP